MPKHTGGEWEARSLAVYAGDELIAHVGGTLGAGPRLREQLANALVMAAGPTLLAAAQSALTALTWAETHMQGNVVQFREERQKLEAAIRKAEPPPE